MSFHLFEKLFCTMYLKWHMELTLLAYKQGLSTEEAEDIASDVLLLYWEKKGKLQSKSRIIDHLQKQVRCHQQATRRNAAAETIFLQLKDQEKRFGQRYRFEQRAEVLQLAKHLSGPEQLFLHYSLVQELDLAQMAERLHKSIATVVNLQHYTIFNLKKILEKKRGILNAT